MPAVWLLLARPPGSSIASLSTGHRIQRQQRTLSQYRTSPSDCVARWYTIAHVSTGHVPAALYCATSPLCAARSFSVLLLETRHARLVPGITPVYHIHMSGRTCVRTSPTSVLDIA
eukprot:1936434-Rhodomonas_salina.2